MTGRLTAILLALIAPLMLAGCFMVPGKFASTLDVRADRSFTFTYAGEIIAVDMSKEIGSSSEASESDDEKPEPTSTALLLNAALQDDEAGKKAAAEAKFKAVAEALSKEAGYRSVAYRGEGVFLIDYAISGRLTHGFFYPYNLDAEAIFPFVAVELRGKDTLRIKAPAFGESDANTRQMGKEATPDRRDGSFTLTTDAEIVSQNNEEGATTTGGRKTIRWKVTPLTKDAPMAVLRVAALP